MSSSIESLLSVVLEANTNYYQRIRLREIWELSQGNAGTPGIKLSYTFS